MDSDKTVVSGAEKTAEKPVKKTTRRTSASKKTVSAAAPVSQVSANVPHGAITEDNHKALWSGRFKEGPDAAAIDFETSIHVDERMALDDIHGSIAHASMLGEQGIIPRSDASAIVKGLKGIEKDLSSGNRLQRRRYSFFYRSNSYRQNRRKRKKASYRQKPQRPDRFGRTSLFKARCSVCTEPDNYTCADTCKNCFRKHRFSFDGLYSYAACPARNACAASSCLVCNACT